nr:30S ribosomal protein S7 [Methanohalophilus profundi]
MILMNKLFGKWDMTEVEVPDPGLRRYVNVDPIAIPNTGGRHARQQFNKSDLSIVERLITSLMRGEENTGQKQCTMTAVKDAFDIIHSKTDKNPVQVLVEAISHTGPREEVVRLKYGGISVPKAVDTAPQRRVDSALRYIAMGTKQTSFKSKRSFASCLATELIAASNGDAKCFSVNRKDAKERVAKAAR